MRTDRRSFLGSLAALYLAPRLPLPELSAAAPSATVIDVSKMVVLYQPTASPLVLLTGALKDKREGAEYKYDWLEANTRARP